MKKRWRSAAALLLLAVIALSLTGCGKDTLTGRWDATDYLRMSGDFSEEEMAVISSCSVIMEFTKDGRMILTMSAYGISRELMNTDYTAEDGRLLIGGDALSWKMEGGDLVISDDTHTAVLKRVK